MEAADLEGRVEVQMGTLGKAIGASGGFVVGSRKLIDLLINKARSFIFSTAPVPAASAAARAGLEIIAAKEGEKLRADLVERERQFATELGLPCREFSPIYPLMIGEEAAALSCAEELLERGILAPAIRYPTVAKGKARIRLTFSAAHAREDVMDLGNAMKNIRSGAQELRI
jgi:8-amino-7-oxononanoate synthase